jgi:AcrR family transcriptional regulator
MEARVSKGSAPGGRRRPERAGFENGLADIIEKSSRLMASRGFHGTSMRELAEATGRSLSGLYHYFRNKEDLLYLINHHGFTALNGAWPRVAARFDDPHHRLYAFIYLHTHYYVAHIDAMRVMNWGTQALVPERAETIMALKDRHTADLSAVVREVVRASGQKALGARVERLTYLLFGMMNWVFGWYSTGVHGNVEALIEDIYRTFVGGVGGGGDGAPPVPAVRAAVRAALSAPAEPPAAEPPARRSGPGRRARS